MSFENKTTTELLRVVKAGLGFSLAINSKTAEDMKKLTHAAIESGAQITFFDPKSILCSHLKSLRLKH